MTKRELKRQVESNLRNNTDLRNITIRMHRPWIYVEFETTFNTAAFHKLYTAWGTAKICWPDRWDVEKGVDLAVNRAFAWTAKKVIKDMTS